MPLIALPAVLGALVLFALYLYIQSWQRPSTGPLITAGPAQAAGNFLTRAWHWTTTNLWNYAGPGLIGKLVHGPLTAAIRYIEHVTKAALSFQIASLLRPVTTWIHGIEQTSRLAWLELGHFAQLTHNALYYLRHTTIPQLIHDAVAPVRTVAIDARNLATDAEGRLDNFKAALLGALATVGIGSFTTIQQGITALINYADRLHTKVWQDVVPKVEQAITVSIPAVAAQIGGVLDDIYQPGIDSLDGIRTRLKELEDFLGRALTTPTDWVIAALSTAAGVLALEGVLTRVAPNLFCRNTKAVSQKLCGFDETLLAGLLAGSLALLVALDVKQIAHEAQSAYGAVDGVVRNMAGV